jgi:hypothetical protein
MSKKCPLLPPSKTQMTKWLKPDPPITFWECCSFWLEDFGESEKEQKVVKLWTIAGK